MPENRAQHPHSPSNSLYTCHLASLSQSPTAEIHQKCIVLHRTYHCCVFERYLCTVIIWKNESFPIEKTEADIPISLALIACCQLPCHQMSVRRGMNIFCDASKILGNREVWLFQTIRMSNVASLCVLSLTCTMKCEMVLTVAQGYQSFKMRNPF